MVHLYQAAATERSPKQKAGNFMSNFKGLFFRTNQSKLSNSGTTFRKATGSISAPIASPESGSEPSSLVLPRTPDAPIPPLTVHRTVTIHLPHHGDNRYDIRRTAAPEQDERRDRRRAKSAIKSVKRRSFGKRINNLWSNFGLLRSSEKIVEFANGHGESCDAS
uniref:Uncharacterized protein n=1 Tax=Anopheles culicifacies TaxID=139723 RepID=A0A182M3Y6_9DIPT